MKKNADYKKHGRLYTLTIHGVLFFPCQTRSALLASKKMKGFACLPVNHAVNSLPAKQSTPLAGKS
jgi:hypothetical protein